MIKGFLTFVLISCMLPLTLLAQDKWALSLNDKIVASGAVEENQEMQLPVQYFKRTDVLKLTYTAATNSKEWKRTIYINNSADSTLQTLSLAGSSGTAVVDKLVINHSMQDKAPLTIYMVNAPKDKNKAATMRLRRLKLATLSWK